LASLTEAQIIMSDENNSSDNETQEEQQMETSILDSISSWIEQVDFSGIKSIE